MNEAERHPKRARRSYQYSLRALLLAITLLAIGLGGWQWYRRSIYVPEFIDWQPLTQRLLHQKLRNGQPVVVIYERSVGTLLTMTVGRRAINTFEVRRLIHRNGVATLNADFEHTPYDELTDIYASLAPQGRPTPSAFVISPTDPKNPIVVSDFSSDKPMIAALRQVLP